METKVKNRAWVKNAVIVFLVILLILTFFSNTIMNSSLAEVSTQNVTSGSITARVRGSGTVSATGSYEVKAAQTFQPTFFANLDYLRGLLPDRITHTCVLYDGDQQNPQPFNGFVNFREAPAIHQE